MGGRLTCGSNLASPSLSPPTVLTGHPCSATMAAWLPTQWPAGPCSTAGTRPPCRHPEALPPRTQPAASAPGGGNNATIEAKLPQNSIFAATLEYIITRNDLTNCTVTLSTRRMYILSQPRIIKDTRRYERKISSLSWDSCSAGAPTRAHSGQSC